MGWGWYARRERHCYMKIIKPITITEAMFNPPTIGDTNIAEDSQATEYNSSLVYPVGSLVLVSANHSIYEAVQEVPAGTAPPSPPYTSNDYWIRARSSERWAVFDGVISNVITSNTYSVKYVLRPTKFRGLCILNAVGSFVRIQVRDLNAGSKLVYNKDYPLQYVVGANAGLETVVRDWYEYFYAASYQVKDLALTTIPAIQNPELTIEVFAGAEGDTETELIASIGEIVLGSVIELGVTQSSPEFSIIDYSRKEVDIYGNWNIVQRNFSKKVDVRLLVMTRNIANIARVLADLRTTPVIWIPSESTDYMTTLLVYGYYKDFKMVIPHHVWAEMNLQIEGLT
jgi:hypothetical protein